MAATAEEAEPQLGMPAQAPSSDAQHAPSLLQPRAETGADTPRRPAQDPQSPPPPQEQLEAGTLLGLAVAGNGPQQEPEEQPIARPQPVAPRPQAGGATAGTAHAPGSSGRSTVSPRSTGSASIGGIRGDGGLSQDQLLGFRVTKRQGTGMQSNLPGMRPWGHGSISGIAHNWPTSL